MADQVKCLNPYFTVVSYNGGAQDEAEEYYGVQNALDFPRTPEPHCTKEGENFDLVLQYNGEGDVFTCTHIVLAQPPMCTCPIRSAAVWIHDSLPNTTLYSEYKVDGQLPEGAKAPDAIFDMPVQADLGKSDMHYEPMEMTVVVTPAKVGKFIHIKFISCNNLDEATDSNIDIEFIGIVGFTGSKPNAVAQLSELEELGVVKRPLRQWNPLERHFLNILTERPTLILVVSSEMEEAARKDAMKAVEQVALSEEFSDKLVFFHTDAPDDMAVEFVYVRFLQIPPRQEPFVFILAPPHPFTKYLLEGSITQATVKQFCEDFVANKLKPYKRSAKPPENNICPQIPNFLEVTYSTFDEVVLNNTKDVALLALDTYTPSSICLNPLIYAEKTLRKFGIESNLAFGIFDLAQNDTPDYPFSSNLSSHDAILLFRGTGDERLKPEVMLGVDSVEKALRLLKENNSIPSLSEELLKSAKRIDAFLKLRERAGHFVSSLSYSLTEESLKPLMDHIRKLIKSNPEEADVEALEKAFNELTEAAESLLSGDGHEKVINILNKKRFDELLEENKTNGKVLVVDWTAQWCRPCHFIAPYYAKMAELFDPEAVCLKVDVDLNLDLAEEHDITGMPTFAFFVGGEKVEEFTGASLSGLFDTLNKLTKKNVPRSALEITL